MFDVARERAKALDVEFAATGQLKGPLHGLPVWHLLTATLFLRIVYTLSPDR
jgi:hypothetical protein